MEEYWSAIPYVIVAGVILLSYWLGYYGGYDKGITDANASNAFFKDAESNPDLLKKGA